MVNAFDMWSFTLIRENTNLEFDPTGEFVKESVELLSRTSSGHLSQQKSSIHRKLTSF